MKFKIIHTRDGSTLFVVVKTYENIRICVQNERENLRGERGVNVCYYRADDFIETTPQKADSAIITGHNNKYIFQILISEIK